MEWPDANGHRAAAVFAKKIDEDTYNNSIVFKHSSIQMNAIL